MNGSSGINKGVEKGAIPLLSSFRTGQVAQAKASLLGNGVVDCALENMAAQEGNGKRR